MNARVKFLTAVRRILLHFPWLWTKAVELRMWKRRRRQLPQTWIAVSKALARSGKLQQAEEALKRSQPRFEYANQLTEESANLKLNAGYVAEAMQKYRKILVAANYHPDKVIPIAHFLAVAGYLDETVEIYAEAGRRCKARFKRLRLGGREIQVLPYYWVDRIGHLTFLDLFIKMMIMGWLPIRTVILLAPKDRIANIAYLRYWKPYLIVESDEQVISALEPYVNIIEDQYFAAFTAPSGKPCWWVKAAWAAQREWDRQGRSPLLQLNKVDECRGVETLKKMGIRPGDWFVCLHVRESGFHSDKKDPSQAWRDSDIDRYTDAIAAITQRGGWVIRMGDADTKPLLPANRVIDYAHGKFKSDLMDVFLCASCRFFIATNSGLGIVPSTFGVPTIAVDYLPLANELYIKNGCFIPKLCWSDADNRYLTFDECMEAPLGYTHRGETFAGLTIRHNTPDEIRELVVEMMDRLEGTLPTSIEDDELQAKLNWIRAKRGVVSGAPMGRAFLKRHADLLRTVNLAEPQSAAYIELIASFGVPDNSADNNLQRGKAFNNLGSFALAVECFREARRLDPDNSEADALFRSAYFNNARGLAFAGPEFWPPNSRPVASNDFVERDPVHGEEWRAEMPPLVGQY